jgi:tetratricopeptide (TPR) repeat protein
LQTDGQTLGFNPLSDVWLDIAAFEEGCQRAEDLGPEPTDQRGAVLREAIALYRADLLVDCYADWALLERERLRLLYLRALSRLFELHRQRGEIDDAINAAQRLLAIDPLREEIHRDLVELHLHAGRPQVALAQYDACATVLRRELAVEPMPETRALLKRALHQQTHAIGAWSDRSARAELEDIFALIREAMDCVDHASTKLREAHRLARQLADHREDAGELDRSNHWLDQLAATSLPAPAARARS